MPGTLTPGQTFDHTVIELSGRSLTYPLDFAAPAAAAETVKVQEGGVMTLNENGELVTGLGDGVANAAVAGKAPMALFAIQGRDSFDANSDIGNFSGGIQSGLVASGGYEIQTTQYKALNGSSVIEYVPNELLTFGLTTDRGLVVKASAAYSTEQVIGVVSTGNRTNADGKRCLCFWTVFCPAVKLS